MIVAHAGAPSQPTLPVSGGGHVSLAGVFTCGPHASWCMSTIDVEVVGARPVHRLFDLGQIGGVEHSGSRLQRDHDVSRRTELKPSAAMRRKSSSTSGIVDGFAGLSV